MQPDLRECYRILDVEPDVPLDGVKRSYRELVKVWHPDRFAHDPKLQQRAQEKLKQINLAYERICAGGPIPQTSSSNNQSGSRAAGRKEAPPSPPPPPAPPPRPEPTNTPQKESNLVVAFIAVAVVIVLGVVFFANSGPPSRSFGDGQGSTREREPMHQEPQRSKVAAPRKALQRLSIDQISALYQEALKKQPNLGMTLQDFSRYAQQTVPDYDFSEGIIYSAPIGVQKNETKPSVGAAISGDSPPREGVTSVGLGPKTEITTAVTGLVVRKEGDLSLEAPQELARPEPRSATREGQANVGGRGFFTVGSTMDEVIAAQGVPSKSTDSIFYYSASPNHIGHENERMLNGSWAAQVTFENGRVVSWDDKNLDRNSLRVKMLPSGKTVAKEYFTVGSSKDDVLAVQGTPSNFTDRTFRYGSSVVNFEDDRVVSWSDLYPKLRAMMPAASQAKAKDYFTVGSTKEEVLNVQGPPFSRSPSDRVFTYPYGSQVFFRNDLVTHWIASNSNPLKAKLFPNSTVNNRGYFTVGSTKDEVLAVQGTPLSFNDTHFTYPTGSQVFFKNGSVTSWRNGAVNTLKAKGETHSEEKGKVALQDPAAKAGMSSQEPSSVGSRNFFTVGATKDEVLAVQGTPTEFTETALTYGFSRVHFENGRVKTWEDSHTNPLRVKLLPAAGVETKGYFTIGSTKDEVLAVQGTPTEFTETALTYGFSRVHFQNGRVTSWESSLSNPLKAKLEK